MVKLQQKAIVNGHRFAYDRETNFLVETGKGRSAYRTQFVAKGNLRQAINKYKEIKLKKGEKKRIVCPSLGHPVIAREASLN